MATQPLEPEPSESSERKTTADSAQRIQQVLEERLFAMHFQPIVDLRSRKIFANEALCRPDRDYFPSPVELIKTAVDHEKIGELGRLQRAFAVKNCADSALFVNLEPHEFDEPWLVRPDDPIFMHRHPVYLEITENVPLKYFDQCHSVLAELRKKGNFLVIDDFGAGFSNLKYIAELQPDIVKLDRELVRDCRIGTSDASLLELIVDLCHRMNARVVAEGIETADELEAVLAAGADFGQGYLFAKPSAEPPQIVWPVLPLGSTSPKGSEEREEFQPSSKVATGKISTGPVEKLEKASEREAHLQDEIKKLTDLLVQSEVARLGLVRRLKDTGENEVAESTSPSPSHEVADSDPSPIPERSPTASSADTGLSDEIPTTQGASDNWSLERPQTEPGVAFSATEEKRRIPRSALLIPLLAVALFLGWFFWPDTDEPGGSLQATNALPTAATEAGGTDQQTAPPNSPGTVGQLPTPASATTVRPLPIEEGSAQADPLRQTQPSVEETPVGQALPAGQQETETEVRPAAEIEELTPGASASTATAPEALPADPTSPVNSRIEQWAAAWAAQNSTDYLAHYSVSFQTPSGESFGDWANLRRQRLARPDWISVELSDVDIRLLSSDRALATFDQAYSSPGYSDRVKKTQVWVFEYGNWHIQAESSEPI